MQLDHLAIPGAPRALYGVIPLEESGLSVIVIDVKDPVTVPSVALEDVHELMTLIFGKSLRNLGITGIKKNEVHLIFWLDPHINSARTTKIQRHTALFEVANSQLDPRVSPVRKLVLISVDIQRESLVGHIKRIVRCHRHRRKLNTATDTCRTSAPGTAA